MEARHATIDTLLKLLEASSFDALKDKFDLYVCPHPSKNISILNYGKINNFAEVSEIDCCRGLVVESIFPFDVISRGFDRFIPTYNNVQSGPLDLHRATIKEDGSLIFLFKYNDKWMLSTMHDFANHKLPFADFSYTDLFLQIIDQPLETFAEHLFNQFSADDHIITFCFEMCSIYNRVVRYYETPTLFLITAFGGHKGSTEITIPQSIVLSENVKHITEIAFPHDTTYEMVQERIQELSAYECTFEGMVLQTRTGRRIKAKNPYYLLQHTLKYRGFVKATPDVMVPLIFDGMDDTVIMNVVDCLGGDPFVEQELRLRQGVCRQVIEKELFDIQAVLKALSDRDTKIDYIPSIKDRVLELEGGPHSAVFRRWKSLFIRLFKDASLDVDREYRQAFVANMKFIFSNKKDLCLSPTHSNRACPIFVDTILPPETYTQTNDGLATNCDTCYCGQPITVSRLRNDTIRYRICHCGEKYGYLTYKSGTFLSVCSDANCICTHEVHMNTRLPLGTPASFLCKSYRLQVRVVRGNSYEWCVSLWNCLIDRHTSL
jgi:hypothetical protein